MTKVFLSKSLLKYRREMAEAVSGTIKAGFIEGVKIFRLGDPPLAQPDLLPPPKVEVAPNFYQGQVDDPIFFTIFTDFDAWSVRVVLQDEDGNVIENGDAAQFEDASDCWDYRAVVSLPSGTKVTITAAATDQLGAVGVARMIVTIP
jgi:hypothetical protein